MFYWDSSAIVSVSLSEKSGPAIHACIENSPPRSAYTSVLTFLEVESALLRKLNERSIDARMADQGRKLAIGFRHSLQLIVADLLILDLALHLQKLYGLRPGDAIQLASARAGAEDPSKVDFLCLDEKLNEAARGEGFNVPI